MNQDAVRQYAKTRLAEGVGNRTVNMELLCLSRAIGRTWRELWPDVPRLPEPEDIGRALPPDEEAALLNAAAANRSPYVYTVVCIGFTTAMRLDEVRALQVGRIDFVDRTVRVGRAKTSSGSGRVIPMSADLQRLLEKQVEWLTERFGKPEPEWYLFPFSKSRRPLDPTRPVTTIKTAWESVKAKSGVKCRFHDLRHTAITKLAEERVPDTTMKALAGHVHEKMLERYLHIRMKAKRQAVELLRYPRS